MINQPSILYKYFPPARIDVLENLEVRFTPPKEFNDPFEFLPQLNPGQEIEKLRSLSPDEIREILGELSSGAGGILLSSDSLPLTAMSLSGDLANLLETLLSMIQGDELVEIIREMLNNSVGVFSLSSRSNNPLMWAHYADSHSGFALGFRTDSLWSEKKGIRGPIEIQYKEEQPTTTVLDRNSDSWFTSKHKIWEYENEYRYVANLSMADKTVNNETVQLYSFTSDDVAEIIIGLRTSNSLKEDLSSIKEKNFKNARLLNAYIGDNYKIYFR